ncbi:MAG: SDR family NAD(P)-dependent oxidoreductase [Planctomyces sp.]|nr:SDR family NAD(P)-dependent oxidoreductase [Planctomyces sp.]
MMMLVTGGAGFLGRRVVRELVREGCRVRCFLRPSTRIDDLRECVGTRDWHAVETFRGDLQDPDDCRRAVAGADIVFHVAAGLSGGAAVLFANTVMPTRQLVAACETEGVKRFVHVSSLGVYGAGSLRRHALLDESCPVDPHPHLRDPYTYSKIVQEQVCREAFERGRLPLVVIRPGVIYGPGRGLLSNRIGLTLGGTLVRFGSRRPLPYVYVDHCATAIRQAGLTPGIEGETFNVLDDHLPTAREVLAACRRAGRPVRSLWLPESAIGPLSSLYERYSRWSEGQLPAVLTRYRSDAMWKPLKFSNARARERLRWAPHLSFEETAQLSLA